MKIADNVPVIKFDLSQTDIIIIVPLIYSHVEDSFVCTWRYIMSQVKDMTSNICPITQSDR